MIKSFLPQSLLLYNKLKLYIIQNVKSVSSVHSGHHIAVAATVVHQGLFFDEAYGFYPGQVLIGPAKVFSNVQWLSGVKPVLSRKSKFRVVVEEVGWTF